MSNFFKDEEQQPNPLFAEELSEPTTYFKREDQDMVSLISASAKAGMNSTTIPDEFINAKDSVEYGDIKSYDKEIGETIRSFKLESNSSFIEGVLADTDASPEERAAIVEAINTVGVGLEMADMNKYIPEASADNLKDLSAAEPRDYNMFKHDFEEGSEAALANAQLQKQLYAYRKVAEWTKEQESQSPGARVYDFLKDAFDPVSRWMIFTGNVDLDKDDALMPGGQLDNIRQALMSDEISYEDFTDLMDEAQERIEQKSGWTKVLGMPDSELTKLNAFKGLVETDFLTGAETDAGLVVDIGTSFSAGALFGSSKAALRAVGGKDFVANNTVDTLSKIANGSATGRETISADDAVMEAMPSAYGVENLYRDVINVSADTARKLEMTKNATRAIESLNTTGRLTEDELAVALDSARKEVDEMFADRFVKDVKIVKKDYSLVDSAEEIEALIGKADGSSGFIRKENAIRAIERMGLRNAKPVKDVTGEWYISYRQTFNELDFIKGAALDEAETLSKDIGSVAGRWLAGDRFNLEEGLYANAVTNELAKNAALNLVLKPAMSHIRRMNDKERTAVASVIRRAQDDKRWMNEDELRALGLNDNEVTGYYNYIQINDLEHTILNEKVYVQKASAGFKTIELKSPSAGIDIEGEGKLVDVDNFRFDQNPVYDVDNQHVLGRGQVDQRQLDYWKENNYRVVSLYDNTQVTGVDLPQKHLVVKAEDVKQHPLSRVQLGYQPGGHRIYDARFFVKQGDIREMPDGTKVVYNPITSVAGNNRKKLERYVDDMNRVREAYRVHARTPAKGTRKALLEAIDATPFTLRQIDEMVDSGSLRLDTPLEVRMDGEDVSANMQALGADAVNFTDSADSHTVYLQQRGHHLARKRTDHILKTVDGEEAPILDPFEAQDRALNNILSTGISGDFNTRAVNVWNDKYASFVDRKSVGPSPSPYDIFKNGRPRDGIPSHIRTKMEAERDAINRKMRTPTATGLWVKQSMRKLAYFLENGKDGTRDQIAEYVYSLDDTNPVSFMKAFTFHEKLGMFNTSMFMTNLNTALSAASVDASAKSVQSVFSIPQLMYVLRHADKISAGELGDELLTMAKRYSAIHGMSPEEAVRMYKSFNKSKWGHVGQSVVFLEDEAVQSGGGFAKGALKKTLEVGRKPFNAGEIGARMTTYGIAYRRFLEKHPGRDPMSRFGVSWIDNEADRFGLSMTSAGGGFSEYHPVTSLITQFWSYSRRFVETLFDKNFTRKERARLAAAQVLFYGMSADAVTRLVGYAVEDTEFFLEQDPKVRKFFTDGLIDGVLYSMSDGEVDWKIGERMAATPMLADLIEEMMFGDFSSVGSFIAGAAGGTIGQNVSSLSEAAQESYAGYQVIMETAANNQLLWTDKVRLVTEPFYEAIRENVTGLNNAHKALLARAEGKIIANSGDSYVAKANKYDWMNYILFGGKTAKESDLMKVKMSNFDRRQTINEGVEIVNSLRMEAARIATENPALSQAKFDQALQYLGRIRKEDPRLADEMLMQANRTLSQEDEYTRIMMRTIQEQGVDSKTIKLQEAMENN